MPSTKAAQSLPLVKRELNRKMPHDVELMIGLKKQWVVRWGGVWEVEVGARIQERQKHSRRTRNQAPAASWLCIWICDVLRAE